MASPLRYPLALAAALIGGLLLQQAHAQPSSRSQSAARRRSPQSNTTAIEDGSLLGRFGIASTQSLLRAASRDERVRGIRKLSARGDYEAIEFLIHLADESPANFADSFTRLEYVKALAPYVTRDLARARLARILTDDALSDSVGLGTQSARASAALALAASSDTQSIEVLLGAVMREGKGRDAASHALIAFPPTHIELLLTPAALRSVAVIELLGQLRDMRAIASLRSVLDQGDISARTAAAVSLAKLGDERAAEVARTWLLQPGSTHEQREASTRTLVLLRAADAPRAISILLADPSTRDTALRIAREAPTPQIAPSLAGFLTIAAGHQRLSTLLALSQSGGPTSLIALEQQMAKAPEDKDLAFALAQSPDAHVNSLLDKLLGSPATRLLAARASIIRLLETSDCPKSLDTALRHMLASSVAVDRQTAAFGLSIRGEGNFERLVQVKEPAIVRATCSAAPMLSEKARRTCAGFVNAASDPLLRGVASASLGDDITLHDVSTPQLLEWLEKEDPSYGAVARELGSRDSEVFRPRIRRLLASGNAVLRAQLWLGLARSPLASTVSLLTDAYSTEPDRMVRRAIVRALSSRAEPQRLRALEHAAKLDPDDAVRSLAQAALNGRIVAQPERGRHAAWLWIEPSGLEPKASARAALVVSSTGLAIPVVSEDDGSVVVPGLAAGESLVLLASIPSSQPSLPR